MCANKFSKTSTRIPLVVFRWFQMSLWCSVCPEAVGYTLEVEGGSNSELPNPDETEMLDRRSVKPSLLRPLSAVVTLLLPQKVAQL